MLKFLGGVLMGAFMGAFVLEVIRRQRPELLDEVEKRAKKVSDKLFEGLRHDYDLSSTEASGPPG